MGAWSGASTMTTPGDDMMNCRNWLSSSKSDKGSFGTIGRTATAQFFGVSTESVWGCSAPWQITCFRSRGPTALRI